jgi:hypothetical protein
VREFAAVFGALALVFLVALLLGILYLIIYGEPVREFAAVFGALALVPLIALLLAGLYYIGIRRIIYGHLHHLHHLHHPARTPGRVEPRCSGSSDTFLDG